LSDVSASASASPKSASRSNSGAKVETMAEVPTSPLGTAGAVEVDATGASDDAAGVGGGTV